MVPGASKLEEYRLLAYPLPTVRRRGVAWGTMEKDRKLRKYAAINAVLFAVCCVVGTLVSGSVTFMLCSGALSGLLALYSLWSHARVVKRERLQSLLRLRPEHRHVGPAPGGYPGDRWPADPRVAASGAGKSQEAKGASGMVRLPGLHRPDGVRSSSSSFWWRFSDITAQARPLERQDHRRPSPRPVHRHSLPVRQAAPVTAATPLTAPAAPTPAAVPVLYEVTGIAAGDTLNVRSGPGANNEVIARLPNGYRDIQIIGAPVLNGTTPWVQIKFGERTGWVTRPYLRPE